MYEIPDEIVGEILHRMELEMVHIVGMVSKRFAGLTRSMRQRVNLYTFGAAVGVLEYCKIGRSRGDDDSKVCDTAVTHGHFEIAEWMHHPKKGEAACLCYIWSLNRAAIKGQTELLKYIHDKGKDTATPRHTLCDSIAHGGNVEALKWAISAGYVWDKWTCIEAAQAGHLELLEYAISNGCPWCFCGKNDRYREDIDDYLRSVGPCGLGH
jgi:hypothetical protein